MDILCVIPARRDSERLPHKNTMELAGKPLIVHTIEQAKQVKQITRIMVISDDTECLRLAREHGVNPLIEPLLLAHEDVPMARVVQHAVFVDERMGNRPQVVVLLQPTSPLRAVKDIEDCIELVASNACDSVTTVCDGKENGAVYVFQTQLAERGLIYGPSLCQHSMPKARSTDIDTIEDFNEAVKLVASMSETSKSDSDNGKDSVIPQATSEKRQKRAYHRRNK